MGITKVVPIFLISFILNGTFVVPSLLQEEKKTLKWYFLNGTIL